MVSIVIYPIAKMTLFYMPDLISLADRFERLACQKLNVKAERFELLAQATKKPKVVKLKDGWVINGEWGSEEVDKILKTVLQNSTVPLIYGDPPFGVLSKSEANWDQGITADDYLKWTNCAFKYLPKGGALYYWGGVGRYQNRVFFEYLARLEKESEGFLKNLITWQKKRAYGVQDNYLFTREELAFILKGTNKPKRFKVPYLDVERGYKGFDKDHPAKSKFLRRTNIWTITELFSGKVHIAQKPEELAMIPIETHTREGEIVLDPFAGSGSTGLAARKLGRKFILIEKDPKNYALIIKRLKS
jgi:16S rRNA G966 N2-methylase RsmD